MFQSMIANLSAHLDAYFDAGLATWSTDSHGADPSFALLLALHELRTREPSGMDGQVSPHSVISRACVLLEQPSEVFEE